MQAGAHRVRPHSAGPCGEVAGLLVARQGGGPRRGGARSLRRGSG
jgi:hypothetical protein